MIVEEWYFEVVKVVDVVLVEVEVVEKDVLSISAFDESN